MSYHISRTVDLDFNEAVSRTIEELKKEGFGVLTDVVENEALAPIGTLVREKLSKVVEGV